MPDYLKVFGLVMTSTLAMRYDVMRNNVSDKMPVVSVKSFVALEFSSSVSSTRFSKARTDFGWEGGHRRTRLIYNDSA